MISEIVKLKRVREINFDQCVLMAQSPQILFCYWELSTMRKNLVLHHLNEDWMNIKKKLRVYDITAINFVGHNAHKYHDYLIPNDCNEYFVKNLTSDRKYCVDIGVDTKEGSFFPLLRSNPIDTPRSSRFEVGVFSNAIINWKEEKSENPEWIEGFSSYSYYEKIK